MTFFKYLFLFVTIICFCNCSDDSDNIAETTSETKHLFFENDIITVERKKGKPIRTILKYTGTTSNNKVTVSYKVSFPNENAALEGDDFELSTNFGTIDIPPGSSSIVIELLASVLPNVNAMNTRTVFFELQPIDGFTLGKPNNSLGASTEIIIKSDYDPSVSDPNDEIGNKKFSVVKDGNTFKIPYYANVISVDDQNSQIKRAVIAIQGQNRNADIYYERMLTAAQMESSKLDTLAIISPQFLIETDIVSYKLDNEHLYWSSGGWKIGFLSKNEVQNPRLDRISSFAVMDSLLTRLERSFPNLKTIVLSGHSAGGQYVNRYAVATPIYQLLKNRGINLRFIVNNPSSYIYLDNKRKIDGSMTFEIPVTDCTKYNEYKYGLDDLPSYLRDIGVDQIKEQFPMRKVVYMVGAQDNNPNSSSLDTSCEAMLQGNHRLERGMIYYNYLKDFYGTGIDNTQIMKIVPGVGHSSAGMFQSELGRFYAFKQ